MARTPSKQAKQGLSSKRQREIEVRGAGYYAWFGLLFASVIAALALIALAYTGLQADKALALAEGRQAVGLLDDGTITVARAPETSADTIPIPIATPEALGVASSGGEDTTEVEASEIEASASSGGSSGSGSSSSSGGEASTHETEISLPELAEAKTTSSSSSGNGSSSSSSSSASSGSDTIETQKTAPTPEPAPATPTAKPFVKGRISIIISGMGQSRSTTEQAFRLPKEIAFAFSPYGSHLPTFAPKMKEEGRLLLADLPVEPQDYPYSDPGPMALLTSLSEAQNISRLQGVLKAVPGAAGVVTGLSEKFTLSLTHVTPLLEALKAKEMLFVYGGAAVNKALAEKAEKMNTPYSAADILLDQELSAKAIDAKLANLADLAERDGVAIAIGRPYPITVERIIRWIPTLKSRNLVLVPISDAHQAAVEQQRGGK